MLYQSIVEDNLRTLCSTNTFHISLFCYQTPLHHSGWRIKSSYTFRIIRVKNKQQQSSKFVFSSDSVLHFRSERWCNIQKNKSMYQIKCNRLLYHGRNMYWSLLFMWAILQESSGSLTWFGSAEYAQFCNIGISWNLFLVQWIKSRNMDILYILLM